MLTVAEVGFSRWVGSEHGEHEAVRVPDTKDKGLTRKI